MSIRIEGMSVASSSFDQVLKFLCIHLFVGVAVLSNDVK